MFDFTLSAHYMIRVSKMVLLATTINIVIKLYGWFGNNEWLAEETCAHPCYSQSLVIYPRIEFKTYKKI